MFLLIWIGGKELGFENCKFAHQRSKCEENCDVLHHSSQVRGYNYCSLYRAGSVDVNVDLTNKEALTVLCSVVKHAGSGQSTKEVQGERRNEFGCFSPLLECSSHLSECFTTEQSTVNADQFPTHYFQFSKQTLFPKRTIVSSACSILSLRTLQ